MVEARARAPPCHRPDAAEAAVTVWYIVPVFFFLDEQTMKTEGWGVARAPLLSSPTSPVVRSFVHHRLFFFFMDGQKKGCIFFPLYAYFTSTVRSALLPLGGERVKVRFGEQLFTKPHFYVSYGNHPDFQETSTFPSKW